MVLWSDFYEALQQNQDWDTLLDLTVLGCNDTDWQRMLTWLHDSGYELRFSVDGDAIPIPSDAAALISGEAFPQQGLNLEIAPDGFDVHCHFWGGDIEFDVSSNEGLGSQQRLDQLIAFMDGLGRLLKKPVVLTSATAAYGLKEDADLSGAYLAYHPQTDSVQFNPG